MDNVRKWTQYFKQLHSAPTIFGSDSVRYEEVSYADDAGSDGTCEPQQFEDETSISETRRLILVVRTMMQLVMHSIMVIAMVGMWLGIVRVENVDVTKYPPYLPYKTRVTFEEDHGYDPDATDSIALWQNVTANQALGILYFQNPEEHSLIPSKLEEMFVGWQEYSVAVFHQLHCLGIIHQKYYHQAAAQHPDNVTHHDDHCFDYLRQSIMCSGDMTLEHTNGTGWGVTHQCRNMDDILAFVNKHNRQAVAAKGAKLSLQPHK